MKEIIDKLVSNPLVGKLLIAAAAIIVIALITRLFRRSVNRFVKDPDARYYTRKFVSFIGYIIVVLAISLIFSNYLGGLTVALGVAGAGIAFALQEVIASFAGWFAISFAEFYKVGDRVQLGGIKGDVIDVGILRTTLMEIGEWVSGDLYSGRVVRIANSFVFKEPVFNYSGDFPFLWDEIVVPVKYGNDHKMARQIIEKVSDEVLSDYAEKAQDAWSKLVASYRIEDAAVKPMITLVANDNWLEFTLRYVVNYKKRRGTKDILFTRIIEEFDKTEGRVGIASMTVHLVETPTFDVRVRKEDKDDNSKNQL